MKTFKLLTLFLFAGFMLAATSSHAQITKHLTPAKDTLSSADTTEVSIPFTSEVKSVEIGATKASGTVDGMVYFLGQSLNGTWEKLDSMTVADQSGLQYKLIGAPTALKYKAYKFQYISAGGVWLPSAYYLRRSN